MKSVRPDKRFVPLLSLAAAPAFSSELFASLKSAKPLPSAQQARGIEGYGKLPLSFEANEGQTDSQIKFLARGDGYSLFLTPSEAVLLLHGRNCSHPVKASSTTSRIEEPGALRC